MSPTQVTKGWLKSLNKKSHALLLDTKKNINAILVENPPESLFDEGSLKYILDLRKYLMEKYESSWHLKSRELCLAEGDNNMKFFHKVTSYKRNMNFIWEITNLDGILVKSF